MAAHPTAVEMLDELETLSAMAHDHESHAAAVVATWKHYRNDALASLKAMRFAGIRFPVPQMMRYEKITRDSMMVQSDRRLCDFKTDRGVLKMPNGERIEVIRILGRIPRCIDWVEVHRVVTKLEF